MLTKSVIESKTTEIEAASNNGVNTEKTRPKSLARILIITAENRETRELVQALTRAGFDCSLTSHEDADSEIAENPPGLVLIEINGTGVSSGFNGLIKQITGEGTVPVMALITRESVASLSPELPVSDFIIAPYDVREMILRVKRLLQEKNGSHQGEFIRAGEMAIDIAKAEVLIAGHRVELTYREYELLRFLATSPGRVFTREALLNRVWGYDYYGGDRTVDVHIRRLRSKIETDKLTFVETVRNIGYRFRDDLEKPD